MGIRGAIIDAKMNVVPVARGYWGNKIGAPHTIPCKVHGKCGSVRIRMIPAPRGTASTGGNFVKATFECVKATYAYNSPDLWEQVDLAAKKPPYQEFTDYLKTAEIKAPEVKKIF